MRETQQQHILRLIQEAGKKGINTNQLRDFTHAADVPKAVSDLRIKKGYKIHSEDKPDGTCDYFYDLEKQWVVVREEKGEPVYGYVTRPATHHVTPQRDPNEPIYGTDNVTGQRVRLA